MTSAELLTDAFGRVRDAVHGAVRELSADQLAARLDEDANSIAWLCWHLARVQDDHVADAFGVTQVWPQLHGPVRAAVRAGARSATGRTPPQVAEVRVASGRPADRRTTTRCTRRPSAWCPASPTRTCRGWWTSGWDPPVTLGVRLVSVISDGLQHAGQAAFIRGILLRSARRG